MARAKAGPAPNYGDGDSLDRAILRRLSVNPHVSKSALAKQLAIPVSLATSRVQALQSRNAVRIRPVVNVNKAGRVFVFCKIAINADDLNGALRRVATHRELVSISSIFGGKYNALIYFTYGDMGELHHIINEVLMKIDGVAELETSIISDSLFFTPEYIDYPGSAFSPNVSDNAESLRRETSKCGLDELDISIISELQCDGRKSIRAIARDYDVSPGTIRYRLRHMQTEGIIRFVSVIGHRELALSCFLFVEMRIKPGAAAEIVKRLSGKPWLGHLLEVVGASDLIAFVNTRDLAEAHAIISVQLRPLPGIKSISVRMLMENIKLDPRWGFASSKH
jgi:Lrp/AsnC family transcriptional regulator, regulator for asnA, asnC and gidA